MKTNLALRSIPNRRCAPIAAAEVPAPGEIAQCTNACSTCNLRELCVPCCGLTSSEKDAAARLVFMRSRVRRGASLYRSGDRFTSLYGVRTGFFKTLALLEDGRDQVTRFSMAGELLGMEAIGPERHTCDAIALEDSAVCAIPFAELQALAQAIPSLQRNLRRTMGREIVREHGVMLQLGSMNAEERLAMLLLDLSQRFAAHGYSRSDFNLRMTREEMGSYLGLKLETVSRIFSKFQEEGVIAVQQKFIHILDIARLQQVTRRNLD
jgi:CRP/FNR family transcriptional regulator